MLESRKKIITQEIKRVLIKTKGNKTLAAQVMGVSIRTMRNWVHARPELAEFRGGGRSVDPRRLGVSYGP